MLVVLGLIAILIATLYLYLTWNFEYWARRGFHGPKPYPYVGTYPKTFLYLTATHISETTDIYWKYYRKHRFVGVFESGDPKLLILDPALITDIYVKYFRHFTENTMREMISLKNDPLLRFNPFLQKSNDWKDTRAELAPAFTAVRVKTTYPIIETSCRRLVEYLNDRIDAGETAFNSQDISTRVIGNIVFDILFGVDAKAFEPKSEFVEQAANQLTTSPFADLWNVIYAVFPFVRAIFPPQFASKRFTVWFIELFKHAIKMREEQKIVREDYLNFLIDLKNRKNLPDEVLQSHAYTYFLDGFMTTSHFLSSALNNLCKHSECQQKLRAEVKGHKQISYDGLHQMQYLDSFLNETTRMEPFPIMFWKTCTESIRLEDYDGTSVTIEKGMRVTLPMDALHKHPDFYPNADQFDPERFDHSSANAKKLKEAGVFLPFGNGPRSCLGMRYAVTSIKAVLCAIVDNFDMSIKAVDSSTSLNGGLIFQQGANTMIGIKKLK